MENFILGKDGTKRCFLQLKCHLLRKVVLFTSLNFWSHLIFPYFTFFPVYLNCPTYYIFCLFILLLSVSSTKLLEGFLSVLLTAKSQEQGRMAHSRWSVFAKQMNSPSLHLNDCAPWRGTVCIFCVLPMLPGYLWS